MEYKYIKDNDVDSLRRTYNAICLFYNCIYIHGLEHAYEILVNEINRKKKELESNGNT